MTANGILSVNSAGNAYEIKTPTDVKTSLGLTIGTDIQAHSSVLDQLTQLAPTANSFIIGNGSSYVSATPSAARTALSLGTAALSNSADFVSSSGGTVSGDLTIAAGYNVIVTQAPTLLSHLVNKSYVDSLFSGAAAGFVWMDPVKTVVTTVPADTTGYAEGARILCTTLNAVFKVVSSTWVNLSLVIADGSTLFEQSTDFQWMYNGDTWVNISPANVIGAGIGLVKNTNVISIDFGGGLTNLGNKITIGTYSAGGLFLSEDGLTASTSSAAQLAIKLNGSTLDLSSAGLKVAASGITAKEISTAAIGNGLVGGGNVAIAVKPGTSTAGSAVAVVVTANGVVVPVGTTVGTVSEGNHAHTLSAATDVNLAVTAIDDSLVYDGSKWVNRKTYHLYNGDASTSHTITHGLGKQYVNVIVIESATDEQIIPQSVKFNATTVVVTLNVSTAIKVICTS